MTVVSVMTGASLWEAGAVALIEPSINGVWFYVLHKTYKKIKGISSYTVKDLREIAGKLSISLTADGKPLNKQQLYANIITKITKLT